MEWTPLPIGVENFEEMITKGYYYVDKTLLIKDLIDLRGKSKSLYPPPKIRKNFEFKHAPVFL